ncbi:hypothetical protein [Thalassoroseus pseudoceratinae]|uniref:hypothetical protein n=1 Tax=Thalassoroseus pseudoceratinae TaxID=2713176 RepID=UPI00141FD742|nr:hypothetical protein [Thalassoroseus pseudoceratinae]
MPRPRASMPSRRSPRRRTQGTHIERTPSNSSWPWFVAGGIAFVVFIVVADAINNRNGTSPAQAVATLGSDGQLASTNPLIEVTNENWSADPAWTNQLVQTQVAGPFRFHLPAGFVRVSVLGSQQDHSRQFSYGLRRNNAFDPVIEAFILSTHVPANMTPKQYDDLIRRVVYKDDPNLRIQKGRYGNRLCYRVFNDLIAPGATARHAVKVDHLIFDGKIWYSLGVSIPADPGSDEFQLLEAAALSTEVIIPLDKFVDRNP